MNLLFPYSKKFRKAELYPLKILDHQKAIPVLRNTLENGAVLNNISAIIN